MNIDVHKRDVRTSTHEFLLAMPERVGDYYNLMPLDTSQANVPHKSRTFRYQTISYKATHIRTNNICFLKRIMGNNNRFVGCDRRAINFGS